MNIDHPDIIAGKKSILNALREQIKTITHHRPPDPQRAISYESHINRLEALRGAPLFHSYIGSGIGNGPLVALADGSIKYDMISGIGVHYFGHSYLDLIACSLDAAIQDVIMQGNLEQNTDSLTLLELITEASKLDCGFITTSGAMACENALKIIFQKQHPKTRLIAFEGCFMGRTLALSHITDRPEFRGGLPTTLTVDYIPFYDYEHPETSLKATTQALYEHLRRYPNQHAAICMELVQGDGGVYPGTKEFFKEIITICKAHGIAIFVDEVQTFARTYELFAFQYYDLQDLVDVVTVAKALHVGVTLWRKEWTPKPLLISQTFTAATTALRAAIFTLKELQNGEYFGALGRVHKLHNAFIEELTSLHERYPEMIRGPFGIGAMVAFTFADGSPEKTGIFLRKLFHNGVIAFVAGSEPTRVRFLPPAGIMTEDHVLHVSAIIEQTIQEYLSL